MRLYQAGDRSAGVCEACKSRVTTRMEYRDYTPSGWDVAVPDVLVAACERCGRVVGVPHQSTPKINEYRKDKDAGQESIEARIPRVLDEIVDMVTAALGGDRRAIRPAIFRYYIHQMADDPEVVEAVKASSAESISSGRAEGRVSLKVLSHQWAPAWTAAREAGIRNKGELVRGIVVLAARDFGIVFRDDTLAKPTKGYKHRRKDLETFAKTVL